MEGVWPASTKSVSHVAAGSASFDPFPLWPRMRGRLPLTDMATTPGPTPRISADYISEVGRRPLTDMAGHRGREVLMLPVRKRPRARMAPHMENLTSI
jgi:hypothetical protein